MRELNSKEKELIKDSGMWIWLPRVKKIFWKIYWVTKWDHYHISGDGLTIHLNGERQINEHAQEIINSQWIQPQ